MREAYIVKCDDSDLEMEIDYDRIGHGANLERLDADLALIDQRKLDYPLPDDGFNADEHVWDTELGRQIGLAFAGVK